MTNQEYYYFDEIIRDQLPTHDECITEDKPDIFELYLEAMNTPGAQTVAEHLEHTSAKEKELQTYKHKLHQAIFYKTHCIKPTPDELKRFDNEFLT